MDLNIPISQVMTKEVVSVSPYQKLIDVKHIFEKKNFHHHIPVAEKGRLRGMISLVDFLYAIKNASLDDSEPVYTDLLVRDIMRENPVTRPSSSTLKDVALELARGEVHAVVIADDLQLKGIVSTADVIRHFLNSE
ncbi:MAG: CBS domain-containing protein [Bacteroidota bacterium]